MKDLLEFLVKSIVAKPESVSVSEEESEGMTRYLISTDKEDVGKVIGKSGQTIKAIRQLLRLRAIKENKFVDVTLAEQT